MLGCVALIGAGAAPAAAQAAPQTYSYAITHPRYGAIGTYDRTSDNADGNTRAQAHLKIVVKILGVVVHRETADQSEVWRGSRLMSFRSVTTTNGRRLDASGEASGDRFLVTSPSGIAAAPGDVVASDPWSLNRMGRGTVVSIKTGKISSVDVTGGEPDTVTLHGISEPARHYHVNTPDQLNKWEVWINRQGVPIKFRTLEGSTPIDFTLVSSPQPAGAVADLPARGKTN